MKKLVELLREQGMEAGDNLAIWNEGESYSYKELWKCIEEQANYLRQAGIVAGSRIAININSTMEKIIAILTVMYNGAKFIVFENDKITQAQMDELIQEVGCTHLVEVKAPMENDQRFEITIINQDEHGTEDNKLFYITTSGSTGKAKLVGKEDEEIFECALNLKYNTGFMTGGKGMQFSSLHFAFGYIELFCQLLFGNSIYCYPEEERTNVGFLLECIRKYDIETVCMPTVVFDLLLKTDGFLKDYPGSLHQVIVAGSKLSMEESAARVLEKNNLKLFNYYGCSEYFTISVHECSWKKDDLSNIPVGKKGMFTKIKIEGEDSDKGILYVGNQFVNDENAVLHCTGDICKISPSGEITLLGREGSQIKINGCRVDTEDIRRYLLKLSSVRECCVCPVKTDENTTKLFAFVVPNGEQDKETIHENLSEFIPKYMIPTYMEMTDEIQRLPSGKHNKVAMTQKAQTIVDEQKLCNEKTMHAIIKKLGLGSFEDNDQESIAEVKLEELEFDSITFAMFLYRIEKEYNKKINWQEILNLNHCSVREVVQYICEK